LPIASGIIRESARTDDRSLLVLSQAVYLTPSKSQGFTSPGYFASMGWPNDSHATSLTPPGTEKSTSDGLSAHAETAAAIAIVARIAAGDAGAETELVSRYQRGVLQMLKCGTPDPELARDICQDTFVVVLRRLRTAPLEEPGKLAGFIARTARNLLIGSKRLSARRMTSVDSVAVDAAIDETPSREQQAEAESASAVVHRMLVELKSDRDRQALMRFYLEEEPKERICAALALTELQFNLILFRARDRMRNLLTQRGLASRDLLSVAGVAAAIMCVLVAVA
jgi:RNA polymerase sigma-70 factor (ECF subfamily)